MQLIELAFQIEMKFNAVNQGFYLTDVPIIFTYRNDGQSKMSEKIVYEAVLWVITMKIASWFKSYTKSA